MRLRSALTRNRAETGPDIRDPRLRGRSYPVPFAEVWEAATNVAASLPGWEIVGSDSAAGTLTVVALTRWLRFTDDVAVRLSLDERGLTRVDVASASRVGRADLGSNARRIARFLQRLDARLAAPDRAAPRSSP